MQTGDMLRILLIFLGCFLVIKTILSLARRKLKEQFCLLWGVIALGLIISGICIRPTLWNQYVSTRGMAVIVVIGALFVGNMQQNKRDAIVLPDAAQSTQPELQPDENEPALLEVTRENVQSIVRYLHRPQYYHQSYTITRQMGGAASESTAELWVSDTRVCAVLTSAAGEKHLLTDGQTLYVWYASDEKVRQLPVSPDVTMDELTGIPTYELLDTLPPETITDGEFITDDRYDSGRQIFAAAEQDGVRRECWISLDYGLLTESILKREDETVYDALQTGLEILAAGDEAFDDVFVLPDGTSPFQ